MSCGGCLSYRPVAFSDDGQSYFVCCGLAVRVHSTVTSEALLELPHEALVTACCINPRNSLQLLTCSVDGIVRVWDYQDATLLKKHSVGKPILGATVAKADSRAALCLCCAQKWPRSDDRQVDIISFDVAKKKSRLLHRGRVHTSGGGGVAVSYDAQWLAWTERNRLVIRSFEKFKEGTTDKKGAPAKAPRREFEHKRELACLAFHPNEYVLATGDANGVITLWYLEEVLNHNGLEVSAAVPPSITMHWHANVVQSLAFSVDGAYLYSGGQEAVLVTWQLGTTHRSFLPRLGGSIESVRVAPHAGASSAPTIGLSLADNTVRLVSSLTGQVEGVMSGLTVAGTLNPLMTQRQRKRQLRGSQQSKQLLTLQYEPKQGLAVLPGRDGSLQFYDLDKDKHVSEVEVVGLNSVRNSGHNRQGEVQSKGHGHVVEQYAFSQDGAWMATVDRRQDAAGEDASTLKFWRWGAVATADKHSKAEARYVLDAKVDNPHRGQVTAFCFHPAAGLLLTGGPDRLFKLWAMRAPAKEQEQPRQGAQQIAKPAAWECRGAGKFREGGRLSGTPRCGTFSVDGSTIAIGCAQIVTLWDASTCTLQHTLTHLPPSFQVTHLGFVGEREAQPHLVAATAQYVHAWDLLTLQVAWTIRIPNVTGLVFSPCMPNAFAVVFKAVEQGAKARSAKEGLLVVDALASGAWRGSGACLSLEQTRTNSMLLAEAPATAAAVRAVGFRPSAQDEGAPRITWLDEMYTFHSLVCDPAEQGSVLQDAQDQAARGDTPGNKRGGKGKGKGKAQTGGAMSRLYGAGAQPTGLDDADDAVDVDEHVRPVLGNQAQDFFSQASHIIPPTADICTSFLYSLLQPAAPPADQDAAAASDEVSNLAEEAMAEAGAGAEACVDEQIALPGEDYIESMTEFFKTAL